jgi:hypothetical protein
VSYYPFGKDDIVKNTIKTFPKNTFFIYGGVVYHNERPYNQGPLSGDNINHVPPGFVSLYEYNVDRPSGQLIHPFLVKNGSLLSFKTISTTSYNEDFLAGDTLQGSYAMSASITRDYFSSSVELGESRARLESLRNTTNFYKKNSQHYAYSSDLGDGWDKQTQKLNLISIPSIFFGSQIKKGSLELNFYVSGTLIGTLKDERQNGELIQTGPEGSNGSGSCAGVALYNEGFLMLTGSWDIGQPHTEGYLGSGGAVSPKWLYYAVGAQDGVTITNQKSSWSLDFRGTTKTQVMTMFANAPKGMINHSNNPTYVKYGQASQITGSGNYIEDPSSEIQNIVSSSFHDVEPTFDKETYISKVGIYDDDMNLLAIAKIATPVKKTEERSLTFKLKLDI